MQDNPQEDGYVECSECGHVIDAHNEEGCTETDGVSACTCEVYWTPMEVKAYYREAGIPELNGGTLDWN